MSIAHYRSQKGFTLVEVLVTAFLLSVGFAAAATLQVRSATLNQQAYQYTILDQFAHNTDAYVQAMRTSAKKSHSALTENDVKTACQQSFNHLKNLLNINNDSNTFSVDCTLNGDWLNISVNGYNQTHVIKSHLL